jgi:hypothetical protein
MVPSTCVVDVHAVLLQQRQQGFTSLQAPLTDSDAVVRVIAREILVARGRILFAFITSKVTIECIR